MKILSLLCAMSSAAVAGGRPVEDPDMPRPAGPARAQLVAKGVISRGHDYCTTLTPDGNTLYFARQGEQRGTIHVSTRSESGWGEPEVAEFSGEFDDTDPLLTPDGSRLYFMSKRGADGRAKEGSDYDIWFVDRTGEGWGKPVHLGAPISRDGYVEGFPCQTADGTLYFFRGREPGFTAQDVYRAAWKDGAYLEPQKLSAPINTEGWDGHAWVAPDQTWMVFYSKRPGGLGGCDLYSSQYRAGHWSKPTNLGPLVNSPESEITPWVDLKNRVLYFSRIHADSRRDIYWIDLAHTPLAGAVVDEPSRAYRGR